MAMQEFLASYAVEVDESGAKRLQEVLESNREMENEAEVIRECASSGDDKTEEPSLCLSTKSGNL